MLATAVDRAAVRYDRDGDQHYDVASAFIKSIRGSDVDAGLHYLARMIEAGEDPRFIARRLVILASEDIGLADPTSLDDGRRGSSGGGLHRLPRSEPDARASRDRAGHRTEIQRRDDGDLGRDRRRAPGPRRFGSFASARLALPGAR